jgi:hypothetical protein
VVLFSNSKQPLDGTVIKTPPLIIVQKSTLIQGLDTHFFFWVWIFRAVYGNMKR